MKKTIRVAMSELAHAHDLAMKSKSRGVKAFGMLICARIALLADGGTDPYCDTDGSLRPLVECGRQMNEEDKRDA